MKEYCGIFGIYDHTDAPHLTYLGLYALQHRGQESAGIAVSDGERIFCHRGFGLVSSVFGKEPPKLNGHTAIGHNRYSTSGASDLPDNIQPIVVSYRHGQIAIAHNGNLVNALSLKERLEEEGSIFRGTTDSEVIVHLVVRSGRKTFVEKLASALSLLKGAYALLVMTPDTLIAVRDPWGFRPLCMGELDGSPVFASETCAFDLVGASYIRDVEPGEMVVVSPSGLRSFKVPGVSAVKVSQCIFEFVYFARPDSCVFGRSVYKVRKAFGMTLAREHPVDADIVVPVPDSGVVPALGFSQESGIPFEMGLIRNHYVGRTFIKPYQRMRDVGVKVKLNPIPELLEGKRVVVVDDSIVRGTTSRKIIKMLRDAGAKEVHMRISSPPTRWPCYFGIDTPTREQLIASSSSVEEIRRYIGADSLGYLSLKGMLKAIGETNGFCTACFDGKYPVKVEKGVVEQAKKE